MSEMMEKWVKLLKRTMCSTDAKNTMAFKTGLIGSWGMACWSYEGGPMNYIMLIIWRGAYELYHVDHMKGGLWTISCWSYEIWKQGDGQVISLQFQFVVKLFIPRCWEPFYYAAATWSHQYFLTLEAIYPIPIILQSILSQ